MAKPYGYRRLMIGQGAGVDPKTLEGAGTTDQVLRIAATGDEPTFGTVNLAGAGVTGTLPVANGGTGQTIGAIAFMQFHSGAVVVAGASTVFLGRDQAATAPLVRFLCPVTGSVLRMQSQAGVAPGGADTFAYTLHLNAGDTALTHTTTTAQASSTGTIAVTNGQALSIKLVTSATAAAAAHMVTLAIRVDA